MNPDLPKSEKDFNPTPKTLPIEEILPTRKKSLPHLSKTSSLLEANSLLYDLVPTEEPNLKLKNNYKHSTNNLTETKSNCSCSVSSYGKNYVLKSDYCKSVHFNHSCHKKEHPWISYYGDMNKELSQSNTCTDYSLFVTKANNNVNMNTFTIGNVNNTFINNQKKQIDVCAYDEEEEEESDDNIIEDEEEDTNKYHTYENEIQRVTSMIQNQINQHQIFINQTNYNSTPHNKNMNHNMQNFNSNYTLYNDETLAQLSPYIIKEQNGCRYIQERASSDPFFSNKLLFPCLTSNLLELVCDQFGNYLFQILVDVLSYENIDKMFSLMLPHFSSICFSPHGTRVIQKLIDRIMAYPNLFNHFNIALAKDLNDIAKSPFGNHVIQKYLTVIKYPNNTFIFDMILDNLLDITNSKHGCCVTQKCINEGNEIQKTKILNKICDNIFDILTNQFGSFAIQYILSSPHQYNNDVTKIVKSIGDNILFFGRQKYSANSLEKIFEKSCCEIKEYLGSRIVEDESILEELILDQYGNYVIQKCLNGMRKDTYYKMLRAIAGNINRIKKKNFGQRFINKLISSHKLFGNILANINYNKVNNSIVYNSSSEYFYDSCNVQRQVFY